MKVVLAHEHSEPLEPIRQVLLGLGLECGPRDCVRYTELPARLARGPRT